MKIASLFIAAVLCFGSTTSFAKKKSQAHNLQGVVQKCHDGDTCRVLVGSKSLKIRFAGIDCPELSQKYGKQARNFTEAMIKNKEVRLECDGTSFDRLTCTVFLGTTNVNQTIVENGWAYDSTKYSKGRYLATVDEAKNQRKGIWNDNDLISPYCYRHKTAKKCVGNQSYMP